MQQWLGWARSEIEAFNATLEQEAQRTIADRRRRVAERDEHLAASTIPEGRPGERRKNYIAAAIVRRPAPKLPKQQPHAHGVQLEPVLEDKIFEHILSVVRMQTLEMERSPKTYASMDEGARRDLFLATLNTHYEGRGSAEAFNMIGKTDILIRFEGKSLFVGECKFWEGPAGFASAIDQLFGYASWRDTKLALICLSVRRVLLRSSRRHARRSRNTPGSHPGAPQLARPNSGPASPGPTTTVAVPT